MASTANILDVFTRNLKDCWRQKPKCEHQYEYGTCACQNPLYLTKSLVEWMTAPNENNGSKLNIEYLLEEIRPHRPNQFPNPESVFKGSKRCILVFAILLSQNQGNLIYIFQSVDIIDEYLESHIPHEEGRQKGLEKCACREPPYNKLRQKLESHLSLDSDMIEQIIEAFDLEKWMFFPACLGFKTGKTLCNYIRLPFCKRMEVNGKGATASVLQVLVHEDFVDADLQKHLGQPLTTPRYGKCYELAVKVYAGSHKHLLEREVDAFDGLAKQPGMVRYFGWYSHHDGKGEPTHNIILEFGQMDLSEYFCAMFPPELGNEICRFWKSLYKIAEAIRSIHNLEHLGKSFDGWHGDVKPDNILLVGEDFKLADFGFTEFREKEDTDRLPKAYIVGGTDAYGAPERARDKSSFPQEIDTWSFGCVLSVAATWIVLGYKGIDEFQKLRLLASSRVNPQRPRTDAFHDGTHVLLEIRKWHRHLKMVIRTSDPVTPKILDLIDDGLLRDNSHDRLTSETLCKKLHDIIWSCSDMLNKNKLSYQPHPCVLEALLAAEKAREFTAGDDNTPHHNSYIEVRDTSAKSHSSGNIKRLSLPRETLKAGQKSFGPKGERSLTSTSYRNEVLVPSLEDEGIKVSTVVKEPSTARKQRKTATEDLMQAETAVDGPLQSGPRAPDAAVTPTTPNEIDTECTTRDSQPFRPYEAVQTPPSTKLQPEDIWQGIKPGGSQNLCEEVLHHYPNAGTLENQDGHIPLIVALEENSKIIPLLLKHTPVLWKDLERKTILHHIVIKLDTTQFLEFVVKQANDQHPDSDFVNSLDNINASPLYYCAFGHKLKAAELLIKLGAWVNPPVGSDGQDVFAKAVKSNKEDMVELMLRRPNLKFNLDEMMKSHPKKDIKNLLVEHGKKSAPRKFSRRS